MAGAFQPHRAVRVRRHRRPPRQSLGSAGGESPASGRTCKCEGARHSTRPARLRRTTRRPRRPSQSRNERNHRHEYPAQHPRAAPVRRSRRQGERAVSAQLSPEDVVRKFFACYTNGRPEDFDEVVAPDYVDYGHTPPGRGPGGARDDYQNAVKQAGAVIGYTIDALVADGEMVAAAWTGTLPGGAEIGKGLSLYRTSGGLLRSTRHALIGTTPS